MPPKKVVKTAPAKPAPKAPAKEDPPKRTRVSHKQKNEALKLKLQSLLDEM